MKNFVSAVLMVVLVALLGDHPSVDGLKLSVSVRTANTESLYPSVPRGGPRAQVAPAPVAISEDAVKQLTAMGFLHDQAEEALKLTGGDVTTALEYLLKANNSPAEHPAIDQSAMAQPLQPLLRPEQTVDQRTRVKNIKDKIELGYLILGVFIFIAVVGLVLFSFGLETLASTDEGNGELTHGNFENITADEVQALKSAEIAGFSGMGLSIVGLTGASAMYGSVDKQQAKLKDIESTTNGAINSSA